jgi:uncharacterized protein (UPF0333 family)
MQFKFNKSSGQVSRLLLVLAIIILVAVVIVYLVIKMAEKPAKPATPEETTVPQPVYEQTLGNIRFVFENARDIGNTLRASEANDTNYSSYQKDLTTTEKYIKVQIGAQNVGKENIEERSWDIENIVDSDGREFVPLDGYTIAPWLPGTDLCSTLLKPAFDPVPCIKIYEVSKKSAGLKIRVKTGQENSANNFSSDKVDSALIDLIVSQ